MKKLKTHTVKQRWKVEVMEPESGNRLTQIVLADSRDGAKLQIPKEYKILSVVPC